jgi:hypothetical protein
MKVINKLINAYYYSLAYVYQTFTFKHNCSFPVSQGVSARCECGISFRESV